MPYDGGASAGSHPRRLATLGRVFGMEPAPPSNCRVLEVGCSVGTNLIHMAASLPGSTFVGIDLFESQILEARRRAERIGLTNIRFEAADMMDFGAGEAPFDYILACGVFSWVPRAVQARLLALCNELLTPQGIAYITYNILPGWYMRLPTRDLMVMAAGDGTVEERVRRAAGILDFVNRAASSAADHDARGDRTFAAMVQREREILDRMPAEYVAHEHLEADNMPVYFRDFIGLAQANGFQYLADAAVVTMFPTELDPGIQEELSRMTNTQVGLEQLMDFIRGRQFRQTLLCREGVLLERDLDRLQLDGMYLSARGEMVGPGDPAYSPDIPKFRDGQSIMRVGDPEMARIVASLAAASPAQVAFDDLMSDVTDAEHRARVRKHLISMYLTGMLRLDVEPTRVSSRAGERPRVSRAAVVTRSREEVTNLLHQGTVLSPLTSLVFELLDGTRDRAVLIADLRAGLERAPDAGSFGELLAAPGSLETAVDSALAELAAKALIEPED